MSDLPRSRACSAVAATLVCCLVLPVNTWAVDNLVFPSGTGMVDVVRDRGVDNTGRTDVTAKLNQILTTDRAIYLPIGTYRVSGMLRGPHHPTFAAGGESAGPSVIGQSRTRTVIRLADGTWPLDTLKFPSSRGTYPAIIDERVVMHSGDCGNTTFLKLFRNFTVDIGKNNDGATGMVFIASNTGCLADVDIVSEDGKGCIGLSFSGSENGPLMVHNVRTKGFKRGIWCPVADVLSISQVVIEGATQYGFVNSGRCALDSLATSMSAPALVNLHSGWLSLLNAYFAGGASDTAAVYNYGALFARNLKSSGYKRALHCKDWGSGLHQAPTGPSVSEYLSREAEGTFYTPGVSLNLPIKYPPFPPWEQDMAKWSSVSALKTTANTWTAAFKSALSQTGKTSVAIPCCGFYDINDTLRITGSIERIAGAYTEIPGTGGVVVQDGTAPVVVLQNMMLTGWQNCPLIIRTSRTVILESVYANVIAEGTGDLFINDYMGDLVVRNPRQRVWVRKLNGEWSASGALLHVNSGTTWILGFKSENEQTKIDVQSQNVVEMFGFMNYVVGAGRTWPANIPLFRVTDGQFSAAMTTQVAHGAENDSLLVVETRGGVSRSFTASMGFDGYNCGLYTGFATPTRADRPITETPEHGSSPLVDLSGRVGLSVRLNAAGAHTVEVFDARGRLFRDYAGVGPAVSDLTKHTNSSVSRAQVQFPRLAAI